MTNLQTYQSEIEGDIQRFKTEEYWAKGTDEEKAAFINEQWAILDERASDVRSRYAKFREEAIAEARKQAALNPVRCTAADHAVAERVAIDVNVDLIAANDPAEQNAVLKKLESTLKYLEVGSKAAFRTHLLTINGLIIDKVASKASLLAVITEVRNGARPFDDKLTEAEALPVTVGEEYDTLKAEREAELEAEQLAAEELEAEKLAAKEPVE